MALDRDPLLEPALPPLGSPEGNGIGSTSAAGPTSLAGPITSMQRQDDPRPGTLDLVRKLCEALAVDGVRYCHWKSNEALDRSANGENDLDLLVRRLDAQAFAQILRRLGFKDAGPPPEKALPGVFHSYGLDDASGRFVHVHAQHQLVIGDDTTKNYRLPIEEAYLDSAEQGPVFRVPAPEFEFAVFVLRMVLKHSTRDAMVFGRGSLSASERRELDDLRRRAGPERARLVLREHLPFIPDDLWHGCLRCLGSGTPRWFRARTARRLERALGACGRRTHIADLWLRSWRRGRGMLRRHLLHRRYARHRFVSGGALIAFVGGDGAGKSTAVKEIVRWLSSDFETAGVHLGKPPRSWLSSAARSLKGAKARGPRSVENPTPDLPDGRLDVRGLPHLIHRIMISRDRYLAYVSARRFVMTGGIVVTDRYPIPEITLMDSAATARIFRASDPKGLLRLLARRERRYYERIMYPDILIALRVHPDTAAQRKRGIENEELVRRRAEEAWQLDWRRTPAVVIDADRPKDEVLSEIRSVIWAAL